MKTFMNWLSEKKTRIRINFQPQSLHLNARVIVYTTDKTTPFVAGRGSFSLTVERFMALNFAELYLCLASPYTKGYA